MINFTGKKIAVLGLGVEGEDLCDYLIKNRAKITVFDQKDAEKIGETYKYFSQRGIKFKTGKNYLLGGLGEFDYIFRSPGFYRYLPEIMEEEKRGTVISSATKLFFDLCPGKIIGVTGTKGKGTTATLVYEILKQAGEKVFLAGNIGNPYLALLPKLDKNSWVVLELSSFQLMDLTKSPHIAIVLFITSEHLDYHKNTEEYIQAKTNLVSYQKKSDFAVLNADNPTSYSFRQLTPAKIVYFSKEKLVNGGYVQGKKIFLNKKLVGSVDKLRLLGTHNWENVCAAITAGGVLGIDLKILQKVVFSFKGLEHRLEALGEIGGIKFYNDSFSTTPETTIAAIRSFRQPIVLICGGSEKGSDYSDLGEEISHSSVKTLILIGLTADKIKKAVLKRGFRGKIIFRPGGGMRGIVKTAVGEAKEGDVILLSPACASFDMFESYKDRGRQFKNNVKALKEKTRP